MATITTLPAELTLMVLGELPAKEIQSVHRVSSRFREVVDVHADALASRIHAREYARLQEHIDYIFNFNVDEVSPPEALWR